MSESELALILENPAPAEETPAEGQLTTACISISEDVIGGVIRTLSSNTGSDEDGPQHPILLHRNE